MKKTCLLLPLLFIVVSCQSLKRLNPHAEELSHAISDNAYQFIMLGDLHYDRREFHDSKPTVKEQQTLSRNLSHWQNLAPKLIAAASSKITDDTLFAFQCGDITHGHAKSSEAQRTSFQEALSAVAAPFTNGNLPFFLIKGNHDFSSPGKGKPFADIIVPFLSRQLPSGSFIDNGNYAFRHGKDLFVFIDCQVPDITFLKRIISKYDDTRHLFIIDHLPILPYCCGSPTWFLFGERQGELKAYRAEFRKLLAQHHAIVLAGHVHQNSLTHYLNPDEGFITQITLSSMLASHDDFPPLETNFMTPKFTKAMKKDSIKQMVNEYLPFYVKHYHTPDSGYAVIRVDHDKVFFDLYYADKTAAPSISWSLKP